MNISITNDCNRRCDYCFQKDWYLSKKIGKSVTEMSPETVAEIVDWSKENCKVYQLLGGEPLLHSRLDEVLNVFVARSIKPKLISNISIEPAKFKEIFDVYGSYIGSILINSDYKESQKDLFIENFKYICSNGIKFSVSTTLLPDKKEIEKSKNRIKELISIFVERTGKATEEFSLRLAPMCPRPVEGSPYKFYDYSGDILNFLNDVWCSGKTECHFDCTLNYCEIGESVIELFKNCGIKLKTCMCNPQKGAPFDVLVDDSVIWCSSANFIKLNSWRDYRAFKEALLALNFEWEKYWISTEMKCDFRNCEYFNPAKCNGLCAGKNKFICENKINLRRS